MKQLTRAFRSLANSRGFVTLFVLNLAIGLFGYIFLLSVQQAATIGTENNLRTLLTADISVRSNVPLNDTQRATLTTITSSAQRSTQQHSFFSMVQGTQAARLLRIAAIESQYPLYGTLAVAKGGVVDAERITQQLQQQAGVWMQATTRDLLGVKIGDTVRIGNKDFIVRDDITQSPATLLGFAQVAPTLYIGRNQLADAGLIQHGSRIRYTYLYAFAQDAPVADIAERIGEALGSELHVTTYHNASNRTLSIVKVATGYLGLIALVALFLSGISAAYLFQWYMQHTAYSNAITQALGAPRSTLYWHSFYQLLLLITAATLLALCALAGIIALLGATLASVLPLLASLQISWSLVLISWLCMLLYGCSFCLPQLFFHAKVRPAVLLREAFVHTTTHLLWWQKAVTLLLPLVCFATLAVFLTDIRTALLFVVGFAVMLLIVLAVYFICIVLLSRLQPRSFMARFVVRTITNNRYKVMMPFVAMSLCALLVTVVPIVAYSIKQDVTLSRDDHLPDFFLFDIQPEQLDPLSDFIGEQQLAFTDISPMVQVRLVTVNDAPMSDYIQSIRGDTDISRAQASRRTTFNVSYRAELGATETLLEGEFMSEPYDISKGTPVALSLANRFANRYQFDIGDRLVFDVQGIEITGVVTSIRKVSWRSFQPNFFILMQPGVLEMAPKTYLATVTDVIDHTQFTINVSERFSNISAVDVSQVIERIMKLANTLALIISWISYLVLLAATALVFCVARIEMARATWEMSLLQTLGTTGARNQLLFIVTIGGTALCALLLGQLLSLIFSYLFSTLVLQSVWLVAWEQVLLVVFALMTIVSLTVYSATRHIVHTKPWQVLRRANQ